MKFIGFGLFWTEFGRFLSQADEVLAVAEGGDGSDAQTAAQDRAVGRQQAARMMTAENRRLLAQVRCHTKTDEFRTKVLMDFVLKMTAFIL